MAYVLFGDPAMRLNYPTNYYVETVTDIDTLHALSVQQVQGRIIDEDNLTATDFNGKVDITIYDKMQVITTRDNDAKEDEEAKELKYNDYPGTLFTGSAAVEAGEFTYSFMVPKDIRYNYGNGRIVYYAVSDDEEDVPRWRYISITKPSKTAVKHTPLRVSSRTCTTGMVSIPQAQVSGMT